MMSLRLFARRLILKHWLFAGLFAVGFGGCNSNAPAPGPVAPAGGGSSAAAPTTSGSPRRIIMLTNGDDPFWDAMRRGMEKAQEDFKLGDVGLKAELDKGDFSENAQIDKLKQYASQSDVAAVAISSVDADNEAIADAMRELRKKGVEVLCIDSDMTRDFKDTRFAYLGTNNLVGGRELGKCMKGLLPEGKYATFVGLKDVQNAIERIGGVAEGAGEKFTSVESLGDKGDQNQAQENVKTALNNHPDINCLVGIWAYNAHAIVQVVDERAVREKTKVIAFDCAPAAVDDMEAGKIDALIVQNPYQMGYVGTQLMKALIEKDGATIKSLFPSYDPATGKFGDENGDIYTTELRVVVPNEQSPLKPEMYESGTKFFYFKDFKAWLAERKLIGS
jgi:ribose transport system substrate-binding protein